MESIGKKKTKSGNQSRFQRWFNNLFCLHSDMDPQPQVASSKSKILKAKQKQVISMSLLGSYKNSILCKISRRNFIVSENDLASERLPTVVSKYIGDKLNSATAVIHGNISKIMVGRIPFTMRLTTSGDRIDKKAQYIRSSILDLKLRLNDLAIYRPQFPPNHTPCLLELDDIVAKQIFHFTTKFRNSIIILPKSTNLDEVGLVLSSVSKFVEVETIVANGSPLCVVVYVGAKEFVLVSEAEQLAFVTKQLKKDLVNDTSNILELVERIYEKSSIDDILFLLRKSINESDVDTIFSCFIRNALFRNYITSEQVSQFVSTPPNEIEIPHTASFRLTARFNHVHSGTFKHSYSQDLLNGQNGELNYQNEVQTFAGSQATLTAPQLNGQYTPYDDNE